MNEAVRKFLAEIGRKGGKKKSEAKAASSRANGLLAPQVIKAKKRRERSKQREK